VLSRDGVQVAYTPNSHQYDIGQRMVGNNFSGSGEPLRGIRYILVQQDDRPTRAFIEFERHRLYAANPEIELFDDGTARIAWSGQPNRFDQMEDNPTEFWVNYIWTGGDISGDGIIFIDENGNIFPYQLTDRSLRELHLEASVLDVAHLTEAQISDLLTTHRNVMEDLQEALQDTEIDLDTVTGRVTMDASVLFAPDSADLNPTGLAAIEEFFALYASVILSDAHAENIAEIVIEGHTAPTTTGTEESHQRFSELRAENVAQHILSLYPQLDGMITTMGMSYHFPVRDAGGTIDLPASRRVVFRFILNVN
jgi:outer membrane protein OmpA-like peptidoglycan-associated protein